MGKASDLWCKINVPAADWRLKKCPGDGALSVKMISYNLFWWNLFSRHDGGGKSAGKLIARTSGDDLYDFMGFQECDDRDRVMGEAESSGLHADYATIDGGRAIAMAYLKTRWTKLASGHEDVGEDSPNQYYGRRSVVWGRFEQKEIGKTVFFVNHHGPLKVSEGGGCPFRRFQRGGFIEQNSRIVSTIESSIYWPRDRWDRPHLHELRRRGFGTYFGKGRRRVRKRPRCDQRCHPHLSPVRCHLVQASTLANAEFQVKSVCLDDRYVQHESCA